MTIEKNKVASNESGLAARLGGVIMILGSILFLAGGSQHPRINASIGPLGTAEFWHNFAAHIAHHPAWQLIHSFILAGPLLWILGSSLAPSDPLDAWRRAAQRAWTMFGACWSVVFVLDGFIAPYIVGSIDPAVAADQLRINQTFVIRLGLVSWLMLACGILALSASLVRGSRFGKILAAAGFVLGVWPFIATLTGVFQPGPFTSPYWNLTAISTAMWFIALAVWQMKQRLLNLQPIFVAEN
jgi:hypothetical protein